MNSLLTLLHMCLYNPPTKRDVMRRVFLEVVIYLGQMWQAQTPRTRCTCVSPRRSVPESASRRPSPGPRTLRRRQTTDKRAESNTRERERHLITEGGGCCHSWSDCFISWLPRVQNIYTSSAISVCTPKKRKGMSFVSIKKKGKHELMTTPVPERGLRGDGWCPWLMWWHYEGQFGSVDCCEVSSAGKRSHYDWQMERGGWGGGEGWRHMDQMMWRSNWIPIIYLYECA